MKVSRDELALRLRNAYTSGAVPPLRDGLDPLDAEGAYAVQSLNTSYWRSQGRRIVGRKIGLSTKAVQAQLGVNRPDYGVLFDNDQLSRGRVEMLLGTTSPTGCDHEFAGRRGPLRSKRRRQSETLASNRPHESTPRKHPAVLQYKLTFSILMSVPLSGGPRVAVFRWRMHATASVHIYSLNSGDLFRLQYATSRVVHSPFC
jgi:hypothetical protein